jgi:hypothetical protein
MKKSRQLGAGGYTTKDAINESIRNIFYTSTVWKSATYNPADRGGAAVHHPRYGKR